MSKIDFSEISKIYERMSVVQSAAADILLKLLDIKGSEDVLDVGCGTGNLTRKIRGLTRGNVAGIDLSEGMIREAKEKNGDVEISFKEWNIEELDFQGSFDVIFCNSAFQWFGDPKTALKRCRSSLRQNGRMGMQAPAGKVYSPNFVEAIEKVNASPRTRDVFAHFRPPWIFLETAEEYNELFEEAGFEVVFSRLESLKSGYSPEQVFDIFGSGAIAGYLNQDYYDVRISNDYMNDFKDIVRTAFKEQADCEGKVGLEFNRIFLVAYKKDIG